MTTETPTQPGRHDDAAGQSLDQIREILFGSQSRDIDERFQGLHEQLNAALASLKASLVERANASDRRFEQEVRSLRDEFDQYRQQQHERTEQLDLKVNNATNELRQQIGALGETLAGSEKSLRDDMSRGFEELKSSLTSRMDEIREHIQRDIARLTNSSVSRRSLSDALKQLSARFDEED